MDAQTELIRQACAGRLDEIQVPVVYHGKSLNLTAADFDAAAELADDALTPLPTVLVARQLSALNAQQIRSVEVLAKKQAAAGQVLAALTLKRLAKVRRSARELVSRALSGDQAARTRARSIVAAALKNPRQALQSEVAFTACFIRDAIRECGGAVTVEQSQVALEQPPQGEVSSEQDMTSAAIAFTADGRPYVASEGAPA